MTRWIACTALALFFFAANSAVALPPLPGLLVEALKGDAGSAKFLEEVGKLKMKCDVCHKPGADKKAKDHGLNDFGEAMHKSLKVKDLKAALTAKDSAKVLELFKEGYGKAAAEKNADGKTFGELIKAGSMPGKNS